MMAAVFLLLLASCKKEDIRVVTDDSGNTSANDIYLSPYAAGATSGKLLVLDKDGNTKKEIVTSGIAMNFRKWVIDGQTRFTYLVEDRAAYHIPS